MRYIHSYDNWWQFRYDSQRIMNELRRVRAKYDSDLLAPFIYSFLSDIMDNIKNKGKYDKDEFESESINYKIEVMDSYAAGIDDGSTIPFVSTHTRSAIINFDGKV